MSETIIHVENISKLYRLGSRQQGYKSFKETLVAGLTFPVRNFKRLWQQTRFDKFSSLQNAGNIGGERNVSYQNDILWALKDVSFEVKPGEVLGIIGRNGSGKSTLLKILSRITEPTMGEARIYGTSASILAVGTGFHPELTGRENIFLNGTILGMKKKQVEESFDEIVSFSEMERFLDTPVKRYSSGMYVRLAFAVAAHLRSDILIVDEVLAVGDLAFQNKCLGKMDSVARKGRTVLFVSHNLGVVERLCGRAILLDQGLIIAEGKTSEVISQYLQRQFPESGSSTSLLDHPGRCTGSEAILREARIYASGKESKVLRAGEIMKIAVSFRRNEPIMQMHFGIIVEGAAGQRLVAFPSSFQSPHLVPERVREGTIICEIPCLHLLPGSYYLTFLIKSLQGSGPLPDLDRIDQAVRFTVQAADIFKSGHLIDSSYGIFFEEAKWHFEGT